MKNPKYPNFKDCGRDYVVVQIIDMYDEDANDAVVTIEDVNNYGGGMSGLRILGGIVGDHRMIDAIYEDVRRYFEEVSPELLTGRK